MFLLMGRKCNFSVYAYFIIEERIFRGWATLYKKPRQVRTNRSPECPFYHPAALTHTSTISDLLCGLLESTTRYQPYMAPVTHA